MPADHGRRSQPQLPDVDKYRLWNRPNGPSKPERVDPTSLIRSRNSLVTDSFIEKTPSFTVPGPNTLRFHIPLADD